MVINVNLTPDELNNLYQISALTGLSIDEIIHSSIVTTIEKLIPNKNSTSKHEDQVKQKVYKTGIDPYAPVFDESDWEMLANTPENK